MDVSVRILGPLEVEGVEGPIALRARRERAVLALLVVHAGRVLAPDRMALELWDEDPPASALTSLRAHISRVRKALAAGGVADLVVTSEAGYTLRLDRVQLDAARFEAEARAGRGLLHDGAAPAAAERLRAALELWRGRPFGDLGDSAFAQAEVTRLEELHRSTVEDRIDADLQAGRHRELTAELDALVAQEPLRERLWGQRMLALYRSGRQADALRAYGELRSSLAEALGILPSPALQQLELAMLRQDPALDVVQQPRVEAPAPVEPPAEPPAPPTEVVPPPMPAELQGQPAGGRFVGRDDELQALQDGWAAVQAGRARRIFLAGEPGIGKSTLAATAAAWAHEQGAAVLLGRCDRDPLTPYQPFVESLRRFTQGCSDELLARLPLVHLREVTRLVPELAERVVDLEPSPEPDDADRFALFEGVTAFLAAVSALHPTVLVLDDLHWADKPTCLLLRHLVRSGPDSRLLLIGTYRDVELSPDHPLADVLADLRREPTVTRLLLRGLDEGATGELVAAMVPDDLGAGSGVVASTLHRETGGNPFYLREVVEHLQSAPMAPDTWADELSVGGVGVPESVREVIGRRTAVLGRAGEGVLALAAVVGARFDLDTLEAVSDLDPSAVLDAVESALAAGLVVEEPGRPGWYGFAHALVREVLYSSLSTVRRLRLHQAVGEELERRSGTEAPAARVVAHHFLEAGAAGGAPAKAVAHSLRASQEAMDQLAYEEAELLLERALEVDRYAEVTEPTAGIDLTIALGYAQWRSGAAVVRETFEGAARTAHQLGDLERYARAVVGLGLDAGGFASSIRANLDLIAHLERALAGLGPDDHELRVRLLSRLAIERYFTPEREVGRIHGEEALAIADRLGVPRVQLVARHALAWATFAPSSPPAHRLDQVREIEALARLVNDREMAYRAEVLRLQTLLEIGDVAGANATGERMRELVSELRMPRFNPWVTSYQATSAFIAGRLEEADRLAAAALTAAVEQGTDIEAALALIGGQQMVVRIHRDGLEPFIEALTTMARDLDEQHVVLAMLPVLYQELDRPGEARDAYAVAAERRHDTPRDATWLIYAWALGVTCRYAGGEAAAAELYDQLLPFADRWAVSTPSVCFGPIATALAEYASVLGRHDEALAHAATALAGARAAQAPLFEAAALVHQAEVLLARGGSGDADAARHALDAAHALATPLGLTGLLARSGRLVA